MWCQPAISNVEAALTLLREKGEAALVKSINARRNLYLKKKAIRRGRGARKVDGNPG